MASTQSVMGTIESFLNTVNRVKVAEAHTEPGSIGGATEHPVKNVDDRTEVAKEGERSKENEQDVKEDQGKVGVNGTAEAKAAADRKKHLWTPSAIASRFAKSAEGTVQTPGSAHDDHLNIGTNVQPTGEDSSNETSSAKPGKEDPGSSHPARTDNDALDGHKYSHDAVGFNKLAQDIGELGEKLCAQLSWLTQPEKLAQAQQTYAPQQGHDWQKSAGDADIAYQAGYELAGLATGQFDKQAADQLVQSTIEQIIKKASDDADRLAYFYAAREQAMAEMQKQANPMMDPAAAMGGGMGGGMPVQTPMGAPPEEGGEGGEGGELDEAALMAALGGGEAAEDEEGLGGEGGLGEGDLDEGGDDAEIAALLEQLAAQEGDEGGEGGGMPPEAPKMASDRKKAKTVSAEVKKQAKDYLKELVARSQR